MIFCCKFAFFKDRVNISAYKFERSHKFIPKNKFEMPKGEHKMNSKDLMTDVRVNMPLLKRDISSDISEDFILADYLPEIRKVLYVRENLLPPAKFVSGNKIDVNGVIDYTLVYVSGEGKLASAPLSAEYSFSLPLENASEFELSEGLTIMAHSVAHSSSVRVSAPRRLQLRSHVQTAICVFGKMLCKERVSGLVSEEGVERLRARAESAELFLESSDVITISEEYTLPSAQSEVDFADACVSIVSARSEDSVVSVSGELSLKLLVTDGAENIERVQRKIPFEAETDIDTAELSENCTIRAFGTITELTVDIGDEGKAMIEANIVLEICSAANLEFEYTKDMYSTEQKAECSSRELYLPRVLLNKTDKISCSEKIGREELMIPENAELVDVCATPVFESCAVDSGKYLIRGNVKYDVLWESEGEYGSSQISLPLKYECAAEEEMLPDCTDMLGSACGIRMRADRESIGIDCDIDVAFTLFGSQPVSMLEKAEFSESHGESVGSFIVCYPYPEDTLWSIAKRYSVRQSDVSGDPESDSFVIIEI